MRYKIADLDNNHFYQLPKSLFTYKKYHELSSHAKIIYAILHDRMQLSRKNKWVNENGDIFIYFKQSELSDLINVSRPRISIHMAELRKVGLIETEKDTHKYSPNPNKIYVNKIDIPEDESEILDIPEEIPDFTEAEELEEQIKYAQRMSGIPEHFYDDDSVKKEENLQNIECAQEKPDSSYTNTRSSNTKNSGSHPNLTGSHTNFTVSPANTIDTDNNNTKYNNTNNNKTKTVEVVVDRGKSEERSRESLPEDETQVDVMKFYKENFTQVSPFCIDVLRRWISEKGADKVYSAMETALMQGKPTLAYIKGVLYNPAPASPPDTAPYYQRPVKYQQSQTPQNAIDMAKDASAILANLTSIQ